MTINEAIASLKIDAENVGFDTDEDDMLPQAKRFIEAVKTVSDALESPRDWTPCAEGMPDTNDDVYITYEYRGKLIAAIGFMGHSGAWYILEDDDGNEAKVNAIAWQPLPAPYRADDTTGKVKEEAE